MQDLIKMSLTDLGSSRERNPRFRGSGENEGFLLILHQMLTDDTRSKIENISAGVILEGQQDPCTTARNLLCASYPTSTTVRKDFESQSIIKKEQEQKLEEFCINHGLWTGQLPSDQFFLKSGGEARVYLHEDGRHVIKLNDAIYYATWLEFLNSILLHNLIFPNTRYELIAFAKEGETLIVVKLIRTNKFLFIVNRF